MNIDMTRICSLSLSRGMHHSPIIARQSIEDSATVFHNENDRCVGSWEGKAREHSDLFAIAQLSRVKAR